MIEGCPGPSARSRRCGLTRCGRGRCGFGRPGLGRSGLRRLGLRRSAFGLSASRHRSVHDSVHGSVTFCLVYVPYPLPQVVGKSKNKARQATRSRRKRSASAIGTGAGLVHRTAGGSCPRPAPSVQCRSRLLGGFRRRCAIDARRCRDPAGGAAGHLHAILPGADDIVRQRGRAYRYMDSRLPRRAPPNNRDGRTGGCCFPPPSLTFALDGAATAKLNDTLGRLGQLQAA